MRAFPDGQSAWGKLIKAARVPSPPRAAGGSAMPPPGGESFAEVCARVRAGVERLTDECRGRDIVAVAHGGSIRAALALALALDPQAVLAFAVENCSVTRLDYLDGPSGSGWRIGTVNQQPWTGQRVKL